MWQKDETHSQKLEVAETLVVLWLEVRLCIWCPCEQHLRSREARASAQSCKRWGTDYPEHDSAKPDCKNMYIKQKVLLLNSILKQIFYKVLSAAVLIVPLTCKKPPAAPTGISRVMSMSLTDMLNCLASISAEVILWPSSPTCTSNSWKSLEEMSGSMWRGTDQVIVLEEKKTLPVQQKTKWFMDQQRCRPRRQKESWFNILGRIGYKVNTITFITNQSIKTAKSSNITHNPKNKEGGKLIVVSLLLYFSSSWSLPSLGTRHCMTLLFLLSEIANKKALAWCHRLVTWPAELMTCQFNCWL